MGNKKLDVKVAIIGSGPSGAIAAQNFIDAGISVQVFDVGIGIENQEHIKQCALFPNEEKGLMPKKSIFGQYFAYGRGDLLRGKVTGNISFDTSHSKGGLSNVWGATVGFPYPRDIEDWPIDAEKFNQDISEVFDFIEVASSADLIDDLYTHKYIGKEFSYQGVQTQYILNKVNDNRAKLLKQNIYVGKSKLAVKSNQSIKNGCVLCYGCLNGCKTNSIFSSKSIIDDLIQNNKFKYRANSLVKSICENNFMVEITCQDLENGKESLESFNYVFLAAGCFDTLKILNKSGYLPQNKAEIKDSQKYYFLAFTLRPNIGSPPQTISLAHLYMQTLDSHGNLVQGQLYPGGDIIKNILLRKFGVFIGGLLVRLLMPILSRALIGMIYLNSNVSGSIKIHFVDEQNVVMNGRFNRHSYQEFKLTIRKYIKNSLNLGFLTIPFVFLKSKIGHSQHFGSSLPMTLKEDPDNLTSDTLGRPLGLSRVFVVDSTVLPTIPASPTTSLIMGNAKRISNYVIKMILG